MQNILLLLTRFGSFITFLILQVVALYLVINYNQSQKAIFLNSTAVYSGKWSEEINGYKRYFNLTSINDSLAAQNAALMETQFRPQEAHNVDTVGSWQVTPANVISNTFHLKNNYITIDKGRKDGIENGMGVIDKNGVVGIVRNTSDHYAQINSILHSQTRISATVSPHAYPGFVYWKEMNHMYMTLEGIPKYVNIAKRDSVITNGYSTIFPKGILIGMVDEVKSNPGSNSYEIKLRLSNDVASSYMVYILKNKDKAEIESLSADNNE